jgi:hypothetical protein
MVCVWLSMDSRAAAQSVALDMRACAEPAPRDVRAVLTVELHEQLLGEDEGLPADARVIEVRCSRDEAELWLRGTAARTVALGSVPRELRARLLALSVAELVRPQLSAADPAAGATAAGAGSTAGAGADGAPAHDSEAANAQPSYADGERGEIAEDAEAEPDELESAEPEFVGVDDAGPSARPPRFLWIGAEAQVTPLVGLGGALLFRAQLLPWLAWSSAVSLGESQTDIDNGKLRALSVSLRTGLAWLVQGPRASFHAGGGIRGRWLKLTGEPSDETSTAAKHFDAWSLGPALFAGATVRLAPPVFLALELELHHALREVRANVEEGKARTLSPVRTSAVLGAGLAW